VCEQNRVQVTDELVSYPEAVETAAKILCGRSPAQMHYVIDHLEQFVFALFGMEKEVDARSLGEV
jgi:hypothetical protein